MVMRRAQRFEAGERGAAVGAGRVVGERGDALRKRAEQRVTMRNGFVAGDSRSGPSRGARELSAPPVPRASGDYSMRFSPRAAGPCARPRGARWRLDRLKSVCYPLATRGVRSAPGAPRMTSPTPEIVRLEFCSAFDMLDFVQVVSDHLCRRVGFDEDAMHWVGVADSRIGDQRHQARQPQRPEQAACTSSSLTTVDADAGSLTDQRARRGRRLRSRRSGRSAGAREHAQVERPRHLPHPQLHGRRRRCGGRRKAAWKCG